VSQPRGAAPVSRACQPLVSVLIALLVLSLGTGRARALGLVSEKIGQLSYQAMHDGLTGLPNRALLTDRADQMLARARRTDSRVAVLFIDLDGFRQVNDTYGHAAGDELLKTVASRLSSVLRGSDTVGRQGGDEFVACSKAIATPNLSWWRNECWSCCVSRSW
jgi:GGDEF domain-containing protein